MTLTVLLARYNSKPGTLKAGQADGLQPRTLGALKSLDVADETLNLNAMCQRWLSGAQRATLQQEN
ncbi:uncharacterized protein EAE98_011363 [Botrytis deweyae]|uniref:Uncharacterized protein n=1 Tax=Botrytis deweyae TaxID=2478750 RepID=A0ABQ7I6K3_9HELO|nr:uncharacterized protein EAE98_011363 [Botrytis deweyae]KAF7915040.1 hypothetical protein EAE98_011363 [Botrytis deweyae]